MRTGKPNNERQKPVGCEVNLLYFIFDARRDLTVTSGYSEIGDISKLEKLTIPIIFSTVCLKRHLHTACKLPYQSEHGKREFGCCSLRNRKFF